MTPRDPSSVVKENADGLIRERKKRDAAERLLGRDAAALFAPDLSGARGDAAQTAELLFAAGNAAREICRSVPARLSFVRALIERTEIDETDLFPVLPKGRPIRVLYARVGAADRAYRLVSAILSDPRVGYAETNPDAAEGVDAGDADLLLLPYADAAGNPVLSTRTLAETYGLYLGALARVLTGDGLLYGLFGRAILPDRNGRVALHLSLPEADAKTAGELYAVADATGLIPDGAHFPREGRATLAFAGKREDALVAAVYDLTFFPGCELRGWRAEKPLSER